MIINPKKVVFETKNDIIDYVSGGFLPPRQSHFDQVMNKVRNPNDAADPELLCKKGREVIIDNTIVPEGDRKVLAEALTRVYGNRIEKRDTVLTLLGIGIATFLGYSLFNSDDKKEGSDHIEDGNYYDAFFSNTLGKGAYVDKYGNEFIVP